MMSDEESTEESTEEECDKQTLKNYIIDHCEHEIKQCQKKIRIYNRTGDNEEIAFWEGKLEGLSLISDLVKLKIE